MQRAPAPRERFGIHTSTEWVETVLARRIEPAEITDVFAVALTIAIEGAVGDEEALAGEVGAQVRNARQQRYLLVAHSMGMGRERVRALSHGEQWATMGEVLQALASPLVGPRLRTELELFGVPVRVLQNNRIPGWEARAGLAERRVGATNRDVLEAAMTDIEHIEARVRADLRHLAWVQLLAAEHGKQVGTANWHHLYWEAGDPQRSATGGGGRNAEVNAAGIRNLRHVVRSAFEALDEIPAEEVVARVLAQYPNLSAKKVRDALRHLVQAGQVIAVRPGPRYHLAIPGEV
ncbi:hypothetical protein G3N30_05980 [Microbacterium lacticum]|uniref:hypothetical protein n=1 Tax=Microbacterium lacticum TaxID=33885 RepID=UPI0018B04F3E|nr:hypothetical protein [Microbacterium lacticum]MBF9335798.1 hypothetical protein [Microbacterium lacticum]